MKKSISMLSILTGAATGAILGILFAPKKGTKMRKEISRKSTDYAKGARDGVTDFFYDMSDELMHAKNNAIHKIEEESAKITKDLVKAFKERAI